MLVIVYWSISGSRKLSTKEGFFNGCKYTPVYKTEQKEKKTIYWRLLMCALQTNRKSDKRNASEIFHWQGITTFDAVKPVI